MTYFIPIFPLELVVLPGENLNLHIFEDRYKQLIHECIEQTKEFAIVPVLKNELQELASIMSIDSVIQTHENGNLDIKLNAIARVRILEIIKTIPDKLYSGAIVNRMDPFRNNGRRAKMKELIAQMYLFHKEIGIEKKFHKEESELSIIDLVHYIGMSIEQEYEVLQLDNEVQQQEYCLQHLQKINGTMTNIKDLQNRIQLNGHFRKLFFDDKTQ